MQILILYSIIVQAAAMVMPYSTTSSTHTATSYQAPTITNPLQVQNQPAPTILETTPSQVPFSALITIAPLSANLIEKRQKCFNDQGFQVNCATWTGYYYTWGGAGHPYAGGPGDGGGESSGPSTTNGLVFQSQGVKLFKLECVFRYLLFFAIIYLLR